MRQLNETGWMHNRLRMVTAMFLTKNLFIDWREGSGISCGRWWMGICRRIMGVAVECVDGDGCGALLPDFQSGDAE